MKSNAGTRPSTAWLRSHSGTNYLASLRHSQELYHSGCTDWFSGFCFGFKRQLLGQRCLLLSRCPLAVNTDDTWTASQLFRGEGLVSPKREAGGEEGERFHPWWGYRGIPELQDQR